MEKRMIIAKLVQIAVITMMNTNLYEFNGTTFLQQAGGPIGLSATCAVAQVCMDEWDSRWIDLLEDQRIETEDMERYMDDIRVFIFALKCGWRWLEDGF